MGGQRCSGGGLWPDSSKDAKSALWPMVTYEFFELAMTQLPELAGGEGFTFEGDAAAFYLSALLAEGYAPGIDDRIVVGVSVQQRDFGEPLDDVIVDFEDTAKNSARLSLQVKRSLTISAAKTNSDFREIIRDSWATLKKPDFRLRIDRYGAAVGAISPAKERALKTLCDRARESLKADHFEARFSQEGSASDDIKAVKNDIVVLLEEVAKGAPCSREEVHKFLAHFVLIQFDFLREGATDPPDAINRIRDCLTPEDADKAPVVWSKAVQLARASAGQSGQFDRARLVLLISPVARLRGATSFYQDLGRLKELAKNYASLIPDDVGGTRLSRPELIDSLDSRLTTARVVQVSGLPGSGKSVVVRQVVQRALECGPTIFLKAEQLEGTSWISYATSQGLSDTALEELLVEIGATGTPILFIDAIDRIEKEHQPIILDVLRVIVESPLLDNWRVVVSLRDTGIEMLRNWLGDFLDHLKVERLGVSQLSDEEAETLAEAKPHLRPLLFGTTQVQDIVRRPFFAKVLNQSYQADPGAPTFAPQSEVDLIEHWWWRGGYNEVGQSAIERQRALLDLARLRARQLSQPIGLSQLTSVAHIDNLRSDGILQNAREGISVRFAHDIFFEWAFFHVLADRGAQWMEEIKVIGEPPAVARVVELVSQWEYVQGSNWSAYLSQTVGPGLRSQWQRAWLVGPLSTAGFEVDEDQFAKAVFADDFHLFRKALVWFQAEKTSPDISILAGSLPQEQRQRFADLLGWPSDFAAWRRLIGFILRRISDIPQRFYPEVVAIFEVWQNALAGLCNPTSRALLQQCATWLATIDEISTVDGPDESSAYWGMVLNLGSFRKSLGQILLRSSSSEPTFAADYLQRVINSERIRYEEFQSIIGYSPILAQSLPQLIVDLSLAFLCGELLDDQVAREKQALRDEAEWRKAVLAKPEEERSRQEQLALDNWNPLHTIGDVSHFDWEKLSVHDDYNSFGPPSPLREPFQSLFRSSPEEALRLLRELCNHAMTAWRQLHCHSRDRGDTPIPLELTFPWGDQTFWGSDREYLWFRSMWAAPGAIGCGFMALEEWCFEELERGRPVDELIQKILEGNECIAILGIASALVLHTERVSEVSFTLVTSQRLLAADRNRMEQDLQSMANLMGFTQPADQPHIEAIQTANDRPIRKNQLSWMVPRFIFSGEQFSGRAREAILNFENELPFQYEEHRDIPEAREHLTAQALKYAELLDTKNYQAYRLKEDSDEMAVVYVSPSATEPENIAKAEEASQYLRLSNLWVWASQSFKDEMLGGTYTVENAIVLAKELDAIDLFDHSNDEGEEDQLGTRRGAVAAAAAITLAFREGLTQDDLEWAREVLGRAIRLPEKPNFMWSSRSSIPRHQAIYVARGLAADIRKGTASDGAANDLLILIAHPLEVVSSAALEEACKLWSEDPKLAWAALTLAFSLCHVPPRSHAEDQQHGEVLHLSEEAQTAVDEAINFYRDGTGWSALPLPPPAWVKVEPGKQRGRYQYCEDYEEGDATETWGEPDVFWHSNRAAEIFKYIPFTEIVCSDARTVLLDFLAGVLDWTIKKIVPPWAKAGRRDRSATRLLEWTHALGAGLGQLAGLLPLIEYHDRFLNPILELEDENCWDLLSPFTRTYVCAYVYDAPVVPDDAVTMLDLCLGRLLQASVFRRNAYRSGELSGFQQPELVRTLMFVSIERADLAARYVNGDWTEIDRILPLVDRFISASGWAASVMDPFLTLCKRAKANYPSEAFADQVLATLGDDPDNLKGWHGTFIPARIAELVQYFAHRDTPMALVLAQNFLRILDMLVDMGDRRSAALQFGEAFREIRLHEAPLQ